MGSMSNDELKTYLADGTFTAKIATVNEDGSPHVVPVWFVLDGENNIVFSTDTKSKKGRNILRDPRVSICIDKQEYPYSFATIFGKARIFAHYIKNLNELDKSNEFLYWARIISERYVGIEKAEKYAIRNSVEGAVLYQIMPTKIVSEKIIADW